MRVPSSGLLATRALLAATLNTFVLAGTLVFVGFVVWSVVLSLQFVPFLPSNAVVVAFALAVAIGLPFYAWAVLRTISHERRHLLSETDALEKTAADVRESIEPLVGRLSAQFGVETPEVRVHPAATPLAYTTYRPEDPILRCRAANPTIVVSKGLADVLSQSELEAVFAHEFAHVVNDDLRFVSWLIVPLTAAEKVGEWPPPSVIDLVGYVFVVLAAVGVGVFSRSRELAADRGAVAATGDPESLAAALERLYTTRAEKPTTDLREHTRSVNAINVAPTLGTDDGWFGLRATHPSIEGRLAQLSALASE